MTYKLIVTYIIYNNVTKFVFCQTLKYKGSMRQVLTATERRLFFEWSLDKQALFYNISISFSLKGILDVQKLKTAIITAFKKHKNLSYIFIEDAGELYKESVKNFISQPKFVDVQDQQNKSNQILREFYDEPFDIGAKPPHRQIIIKITNDYHVLALCWHHIIIDAFSIKVILQDIEDCYNHDKCNTIIVTPVIQKSISQEVYENNVNYWRQELSNCNESLYIDGLSATTSKSTRYLCKFSKTYSKQLLDFFAQNYSTLFENLVSFVTIYLFLLTEQKTLCLGYVSTYRNNKNFKDVGSFFNLLPLVIEINGDETFQILLQKIQSKLKENAKHKELSIEEIIKLAPCNSSFSRALPFNIEINQTTSFGFSINLNNLKSAPIHRKKTYTQRDIDLTIRYDFFDDRIILELETITVKHADVCTKNIIKSIKNIIGQIYQSKHIRIKDVTLLSTQEISELLNISYTNINSLNAYHLAHYLFEENAKKFATNIICENIDYKTLNIRSNKLARILKNQFSLQEGDRVILLLDTGSLFLAGILACLKLGVAYVPIDPMLPEQRVKYIASSSESKLILTDQINASTVKSIAEVTRITTQILSEEYFQELKNVSESNLDLKFDQKAVAYIIYTSGSTGLPKGVMISHRSIINLIADMSRRLNITTQDKIFSIASISFDMIILDIFLTLSTGCTIAFALRDSLKNVSLLLEQLTNSGITIMQSTPSMWQFIIESGWKGNKHLTAIVGGELLHAKLAKTLLNITKKLYHFYGPTETTVWSSACQIKDGKKLSLGKAIQNTTIYVLNGRQELIPKGNIGELYIGGAGVAEGYIKDISLTKKKFLYNQFANSTFKTKDKYYLFYRTGDLVRWTDGNELEFIGRIDNQVKINGYRVELEEIEKIALSYKLIEQTSVTLEEHQKNKFIICYYSSMQPIDEEDFRYHFKRILPHYMVPHYFMRMKSFVLNNSGKINKHLLKYNFSNYNQLPYKATTKLQKKILKIFQSLLCKTITLNDNFFSLGGYSLLALKVINLARKQHIALELVDLYQAQNFLMLSKLIESKLIESKHNIYQVNDKIHSSYGSLTITPFQTQVLQDFIYNPIAFNITLTYELVGNLRTNLLIQAINYVIEYNEALRIKFIEVKGKCYQSICKYSYFDVTVKDLNNESNPNINDILATFCKSSFDIYNDLPIKVLIIKKSPEKTILVVILNHLLLDGWSLDLFIKHVSSIYNELLEDNVYVSRKQANRTLYSAYLSKIEHNLKKVTNDTMQKIYDLYNIYINQSIHMDFETINIENNNYYSNIIDIPVNITQAITNFTSNNKISITQFIAAVFTILLHVITKNNIICFEFPVNKRIDGKGHDLMGNFVSYYPFFIKISKDSMFLSLLEDVKNHFALILNAHGLPFEYINKNIKRKIGNVIFASQTLNNSRFILNGLSSKFINDDTNVYKDFILNLYADKSLAVLSFSIKKDLISSNLRKHILQLPLIINKIVSHPDIKVVDCCNNFKLD